MSDMKSLFETLSDKYVKDATGGWYACDVEKVEVALQLRVELLYMKWRSTRVFRIGVNGWLRVYEYPPHLYVNGQRFDRIESDVSPITSWETSFVRIEYDAP